MKTDLFQSCGHCWVFQICWHIECNRSERLAHSRSRYWLCSDSGVAVLWDGLGTCHIARADHFTSLHLTSVPPAQALSVQPGRDLRAEGTCSLVGCTLRPSYGPGALGCLWGSVLALWMSLYWRKQISSGRLNNTMMGWGGGGGKRGKKGGEKQTENGRKETFCILESLWHFYPTFEQWAPHFSFGLSSVNYVAKPERAVRRHVEWGGLRQGTDSSPRRGSVARWCEFL